MRRRQLLATGAATLTTLVNPTTGTTAAPYTPLAQFDIRGAKEALVTTDNRYVAVAVTDGFAIVDCTDPNNPRVVVENRSILADHEHGPLAGIWDIALSETHLAVAGPAGGDVTDILSGVAVYDITDPTTPNRVTVHETQYPIHNCAIQDDTVYLTGNDGDRNPVVTVDAFTGQELGRWSILDANRDWERVPPGLRPVHDVTVHDNHAALACWDAGTWLLDISDPGLPTAIVHTGVYTPGDLADIDGDAISQEGLQLPGNSHFAAVDDDHAVLGVGREAWDLHPNDDRNGGPGGIDLYSLQDRTTLQHLTHIAPPPTPDPTPTGVVTTAHNFELTTDRLYAAWYQGGVTIHDITDPTTPQQIAWWRHPDTTSFWTARRGNDWVVAPSHENPDDGGDGGSLYFFPDRAGEQPSPPPLTPTPTTTTPTTTTTTTPTTTTQPPTTTTPTTTPGQPGFGFLTVSAVFGYAAWRYLTRDT